MASRAIAQPIKDRPIKKKWISPVVRKLDGKEAEDAQRLIRSVNQY